MTYKQAMKQRCKCAKFIIGGWYGDEKTGQPLFARVSTPILLCDGITMCEEHTLHACYAPVKLS